MTLYLANISWIKVNVQITETQLTELYQNIKPLYNEEHCLESQKKKIQRAKKKKNLSYISETRLLSKFFLKKS